MCNENIKQLKINEIIIDKYINSKNFDLTVYDVRNLIYYFFSYADVSIYVNAGKYEAPDASIEVLTGIYSNCSKKMKKDIGQSINLNLTQIAYRNKIYKDIWVLGEYKALSNIMPVIHKNKINIYDVFLIKGGFHLDYKDDKYLNYECMDILLTRINLICDFNFRLKSVSDLKKFSEKYYKSGSIRIDLNSLLFMYKKYFNKFYLHYKNYSYLLCDEFLKEFGNFDLEDFNRFLASIYCFNQIEKDVVKSTILKEGNIFLDKCNIDKNLTRFYTKNINYDIFKNNLCSFGGFSKDSFDEIMKYFMYDYDDDIDLSGDDYIVPFVRKNGVLYFNTIFNAKMVSPRNLIYAINKLSNIINNDGKYNSVSKKLELNFLNFMKGVFESYNLSFFEGKEWRANRNTKGEIDAVVVCDSSKTILIVQTKTVIAASNYRTLTNLQANMYVAIDQIERFDGLDKKIKNQILSDVIGKDVSTYEVVNCINSDGGIGTALIWEKIYKLNIVPFNMAVIVKYFNNNSDLKKFKLNMYSIIEDLVKLVDPQLRQCTIDFEKYCNAPKIYHDDIVANYDLLADDAKKYSGKISELLSN
ncbi:MAG: hypothetical protein RR676_12185 [Acinetobacter sp.]